jgi:hypothetical protein
VVRSLPPRASGFDTHRDAISSRFDCRSARRTTTRGSAAARSRQQCVRTPGAPTAPRPGAPPTAPMPQVARPGAPAAVSRCLLACIGSPCLRHCVHGASIGGDGGGGGGVHARLHSSPLRGAAVEREARERALDAQEQARQRKLQGTQLRALFDRCVCLPACLPVGGWVGVVDGGHPACQPVRAGRCRAWFPAERLASLSLLRVRVEIMGPGKSEIVGKSQSVLRGGRSQAPRGWRLTRARSRPSWRRRRRPAPGLLGVWAALTPQPSSQRSKRRRGGWGMRTGVPTTVR